MSSSTSAHLQPNLSRWNRCVKRAVCRMMAQSDIDDLCEVCECQPIPPSSVCVPMTGEEWIHFSRAQTCGSRRGPTVHLALHTLAFLYMHGPSEQSIQREHSQHDDSLKSENDL